MFNCLYLPRRIAQAGSSSVSFMFQNKIIFDEIQYEVFLYIFFGGGGVRMEDCLSQDPKWRRKYAANNNIYKQFQCNSYLRWSLQNTPLFQLSTVSLNPELSQVCSKGRVIGVYCNFALFNTKSKWCNYWMLIDQRRINLLEIPWKGLGSVCLCLLSKIFCPCTVKPA